MRQPPKQTYKTDSTKGKIYEIVCIGCGHFTRHEVLRSISERWQTEDLFGFEDYEIVICRGCSLVTFVKRSRFSEDLIFNDLTGETELEEKVNIYPPRLEGFSKIEEIHLLPFKIKTVYQETYSALAVESWTLAAMGVRTLIEMLCIDEGISKGKLKTKIDTLKEQGQVSPITADLLHRIRFLGNEAVHTIEMPTREELKAAWILINNLLSSVYIVTNAKYALRKNKLTPPDSSE